MGEKLNREKISACVFLVLIVVSAFIPAYASFKKPSITDEARCLMPSELSELSGKLDHIRKKYDLDVVIYTEPEMTAGSVEERASNIYDSVGYGVGEDRDGVMLYICSETREYHFITHGRGVGIFNSNGLAYIESELVPHLSEEEYYEAFEAYIERTDELLSMSESGSDKTKADAKYSIVIIVLIAAVLPVVWIIKRKAQNKD